MRDDDAPLPDLLTEGQASAPLTLALAHGAGAPMDSDWMNVIAGGVAAAGYRVVRFEFPYMAERRVSGKKRPPNPARILTATWHTVIDHLGAATTVIGGKSMGGRMASMVADEAGVAGLVCLGYPFHPPGRPEKLRVDHLENLRTPALFCQGTRDTFGTREEVPGWPLSANITMHWLEDGDHGFKPRKKSGLTEDGNLADAIAAIVRFMEERH